MTKKSYQKRLPTVLLPQVRPPRLPAPRTSSESVVLVPEPTAPEPTAPEPSSPEAVERAGPLAAPASLAPPAVESRPSPPPPAPAPAPRRRLAEPVVGAALGLLGLVVVIVGSVFVFTLTDKPLDPGVASPIASPVVNSAPQVLAPDESYVETRVTESGDVVVRQWIRAGAPLNRLSVRAPQVQGSAALSATGVEVLADGALVDGPTTVTDAGATYIFDETTDVQLSYVLTGAVERSESAAGRALALATTLDVRYSPQTERETRVVRAYEVLSLACSASPEAAPVPCGQADGLDHWQVELVGPHVVDRVVAQITVG